MGVSAPRSIEQAGPRTLRITWADGHVSDYDVVELRRSCRCAHCIEEWTGRQILEPQQVSDQVRPRKIEPVGRYAIHFDWTDGHSSGIYTLDYLRELCPCPACRSAGE